MLHCLASDLVVQRHGQQRKRNFQRHHDEVDLVLISSQKRSLNCARISVEKDIWMSAGVLGSPLNSRERFCMR